MKIRNLFLLLFAVVFFAPVLAADAPDCETAPQLDRGSLKVWPLHERVDLVVPGDARTGLMNTFGEFQCCDNTGTYLHTGIDIRGLSPSNPAQGDIVRVVADGDLWAVPNFDEDGCESLAHCRVYIKSTDRRHVYYYAHLKVSKGGDEDALDSELRDQLAKASLTLPKDDLPVGSNPVFAGQHLAGLGIFSPGFTHLHFAIFDACENYDGLNPLIFLAGPIVGGVPYVDKTVPTIGPVRLVREDGKTEVNPGSCAPVTGKVDVVAEARDAYHDLTPAFPATHSNGIFRARYRIRRTPSGPPHDRTWYVFDRAPFRCRGAQRGINCADPDAVNSDLLDQNDFIDKVALIAKSGSGAPSLGVSFADVLFNHVDNSLFQSSSDFDGTEVYFHTLTHEWGFPDQPGTWDTTQFPDGRYQVSVEVADLAGNKAASHRFVVLQNKVGPIQTSDLVIRDHPDDAGAVPSTWGGKAVGLSPDIKVMKPAEAKPLPNAAVWNEAQKAAPKMGQPHNIWVRVKNTGCQTLHNVRARAAWANPSLTQKTQIGLETGLGVSLTPGSAVVLGPFAWIPGLQQAGDGSLLSIVRADGDPATVAGFAAVVNGTVENDSNVGQLNLKVQ